MFHLEVMGGLCSRLRAVIGGMAFAESIGTTLHVNWPHHQPNLPDTGGFQAKLSDIWQYDDSIVEHDRIQNFPKEQDGWKCDGGKLRTCHLQPFAGLLAGRYCELFYRHLWSEPVKQHVDSVHDQFVGGRTVGVQIRSWLSQPDAVGPEWYIERMRAIRERFPDVLFFLSCDEQAVRHAINLNVNGIVEQDKGDFTYDRRRIQQQAADIYLMHDCDWVIGANRSSWSQLIALIRGAERTGPLSKPNNVRGGFYEDPWNPADGEQLEIALS